MSASQREKRGLLLRYRGAASRRCRRVRGRLGDDREEAIRTDDWVKVGSAPNETSALLMEGVLNNAGIPVLIRRGAGFDVPDFLSAGPRDVLVPEPVAEEARQLLGDTTGLGSWAP